jgi:hypothetical protein
MSQVFCNGNNAALGTTAVTNYANLIGAGQNLAWNAILGARWLVAPCAGVFKNLRVKITAAPAGAATRTFTLVTGLTPTATALTCPFGVADTDVTDSTHSVSVSAGDALALQHVSTSTPAAATAQWSVEFVPTTATDVIYGGGGGATPVNSAQRFMGLLCGGGEGQTATEVNVSHVVSVTATITAFYVQAETAPGAGKSFLYQIYKNGSAEASSNITIADAATTGNVTGLSIAVSPGDTLSLSSTPTSSPAATRIGVGVCMTASVEGESMVVGSVNDAPSTSATEFNSAFTPSHTLQLWNATEASMQSLCGPTGFDLRDMRVTLTTAPSAGKSFTYSLNVGGTPSALSITIADANTSGTDSSTVTCANGNLLSMSSVPSGTPTAPGINKWSMVQYIAPPSGTGNPWNAYAQMQ